MLTNYSGLNNNTKSRDQGLMSMDMNDGESDLSENVKKYDEKLLRWLARFYKSITREDFLDMNEINKLLDTIKVIRTKQDDNYLTDLLFPEYAINAKFPVDFPIPTSSFMLHNSFPISTNASGNFAMVMNPFFMEQTAGASLMSSVFINNDVSLSGNVASNFFLSTAVGQTLPLAIYQRYRLVSASIQIRYIYRLDASSGILGGAIGFEDIPAVNLLPATPVAALARYGIFSLIDQMYFNTRQNVLDGLRLLYVPVDTTQGEFNNMGIYKPGTNFLVYGQSFPASQQCIRVDYYCNFECTADPAFQKYIPSDLGQVSNQQLRQEKTSNILESGFALSSATAFDTNAKKDREVIKTEGLGFFDGIKNKIGDIVSSATANLLPAMNKLAPIILKTIMGF